MGLAGPGGGESYRGVSEFAALVTEVRGVPVVTVTGEIDLSSAPRLRTAIIEATPPADAPVRCVVVDLTRVEFIDSSGLGVLIGRYRELKAAGMELRIVLRDGGPAARIIRMTGLESTLDVYGTKEEAVAEGC
ncbi:anti-sigma factor antagonist [Rubrobacter taiwanensis]|jgi:anti-anti-sigma factor|uniref:Anti-sigma factor antagonist n=1 Tax=Rubrobacter taiwanensis TaxID=185139 RepID=A0A4R1BSJ0_9ACTN|nr:STAS domain-containing protein [Rubrobacter taiwanensis]TCJ20598.1 anti-sigma factor antagonist [Rubrobacter taiwanensis]